MRPRVETRGNTKIVEWEFDKMLRASMRPRVETRGNIGNGAQSAEIRQASMRPRVETRGNSGAIRSMRTRCISFNEAACRDTRKFVDALAEAVEVVKASMRPRVETRGNITGIGIGIKVQMRLQ